MKPMSARQFEKALDTLGLDQVRAAELLNVTDRAIRFWISGRRPVSGTAEAFLRYLLSTKTTGAQALSIIKGN